MKQIIFYALAASLALGAGCKKGEDGTTEMMSAGEVAEIVAATGCRSGRLRFGRRRGATHDLDGGRRFGRFDRRRLVPCLAQQFGLGDARSGDGDGIGLSSFGRRAALALAVGESQPLLSSEWMNCAPRVLLWAFLATSMIFCNMFSRPYKAEQ